MKYFVFLSVFFSLNAMASMCASDAKKYCQGIEKGKGQVARCLSDYQDSLTPACQKELSAYKTDAGKKNPCFEELAEYCSDIPSDPINYEYCLIKNQAKLGPKCSADFQKKKGRIITRNLCAQDIASLCYSEISGPEGSINRCLIKNRTKLSGFCQKSVDQKVAKFKKNNACYDDTEKLCPSQVKFIDIQDCLNSKIKSLSPNCKKLVDNEVNKMKANPCYRDLISHCRIGIGPKEQNECLTLNQNHLSNSCRQFRAVESSKIKKMEIQCESDRLKLCKDAPFKDGAIVKCLRKNKIKVSKGCSSLL